MLPVDIKIGIHHGYFCRDNFIHKKFPEIASCGSTFNIITIQHRTKVNNPEPY